jgi:hypothetical protein
MTGFLLPAAQYASYAGLLTELGIHPLVINDGSTLRQPSPLGVAAECALEAAEREAARMMMAASSPLVLVGHSRGAEECVLAAEGRTLRRGHGPPRPPRRDALRG